MIKNKETFLKEIALLPEMKDNIISIVFAQHPDIDISKKEKFYDNVISFYKRYREDDRAKIELKQEEDKSLDEWRDRDLRIKNIKLRSVRYYPDSAKPFGIDFSNHDGQPQSMVILGANSSGKSSLFNAMEYAYCNDIGEAKLREINNYKEYLVHSDNEFKMSECVVETLYKPFNIQNENIPEAVRKKINPDTHFISEYDIIENGKRDYESSNDKSFHYLIAKSLGLAELLEFENSLEKFGSYNRQIESNRIKDIEKNIKSNKDFIDKNKVDIGEKQSQLQALEENEKIVPEDTTLSRARDILSGVKQRNITFSFDIRHFIETVDQYIVTYDDFSIKKIKLSGFSEIQFLNLGLELLKGSDSCPFCNSSTKTVGEIEKEVRLRIEKIDELDKLIKRLNVLYDSIYSNVRSLLNESKLIYSRISNELNSIKESSEFDSLFTLNQDFILYLSEFLNSEFMLEIDGMTEKNESEFDNKKYIRELLLKHDDFIKKELPSFLDKIIDYIAISEDLVLDIEKALLQKSVTKTVDERIILLKNDIERITSQIVNAESSIQKSNNDIIPIRETQSQFDTIKREVNKYLPLIKITLNNIVEDAFSLIKDVVEKILNEFFKYDKREIKLQIFNESEGVDKETGELLGKIITAQIISLNNSFQPQNIKKYLNAFHYKLFCTLVGISIAVVSRNNTGINMPLVLDDVFYASDFENRSLIEKFLISLFQIFKEYSNGKDLQLIMFTHDQMIFESAMNSSAYIKDEIIFAKLFPYYTTRDNGDYKELVFRLPSELPSLIIKKAMLKI